MEYYTVTQAAKELGLSVYGIRARIERGEIQAEKMSPRLWLIPETEVERWKGKGKLKPGPKPKSPTAADVRRDQVEHQDALDEVRRRIRGETSEPNPE